MGDQISVAALGAIIGMGVGILGFVRTGKKDLKEDTSQIIRMESKIDNIAKGVDDIRLDIRDHGRKIDSMHERLTRCEESTKSGHKRLDEHLQVEERSV